MPNTDPKNRALYDAVVRNDLFAVRELVNNGINAAQLAYGEFDRSWGDWLAPLEKAVQLDNREIVQILLETGVNFPYWYRIHFVRALNVASYFGNVKMVQLLLQAEAKDR